MIIDYIKILGLLKDRYSDRFISYENIDESQNEQVKKYITENFSEKEILEKTSELSKIIHESRVGGVELPIALEKFVLNI